ncbi:DUF1552 domain-containing protein [Lignipirellula cremea]|uniref:DUF1552 domain-containing protein n=1 Tax=Lignipirellula cremea TaxID=2528010 RepID=A0A518DKP4_9BACT|nr:DUF1552 domain-containing protein [Lignipirellula cremea]QDU92409.1 hypothetical protein Pla8534_01570 [Lignipirellula cremea]
MPQLPRRTFLRGLGVTLGLPFLNAMLPTCRAEAEVSQPPIRLGWIYFPNGMVRDDWTPTGEGRDFQFNRTNAPLARVRDDVLLISNLAHDKARPNGDGPGAHSRCGATYLTATQAKKTGGKDIYLGESIDQVAARHLGQRTRLPSLELGVEPSRKEGRCDSGYSCIYLSNISWRSPTQPSGVEIDPCRAFDRLFGASGSQGERFRQRSAARQSVLDFVAEDARSLRRRLGPTDRRKMEEYFESVRAVEQQIDRMAELPPIDLPASGVALKGELSGYRSTPSDVKSDGYVEHIRLMYDLMALAYQTDATRIITFMLANAQTNRAYVHLDIKSGHHQLTHSVGQEEELQKIDQFHVEEFARFVAKLKSIEEAGGTLLDNCLLTFGTAMGDGRKHDHSQLPCVVAGRGGGRVETGRHLNMKEETPMANLFVSTARQAGAPIQQFGDSTGRLAGFAVDEGQ